MDKHFAYGSSWNKWDLHVHTPETKLSDHYKDETEDVWKIFCKTIEESDVQAFGITDYFSVENYFKFKERHALQYPESKKVFFPNIELRLEVSVNKKAEEVNIHVVFSNEPHVTRARIEEFLLKLNTNITIGQAIVSCKNLSSQADFEKAAVRHADIRAKLREVFGNDECYLLVTAANNAGLRPDGNSPRKLTITDEIDKISDAFFGGEQNVQYYLNPDRYETDEKATPKPVVSGCDAHSFPDCDSYLGKKVTRVVGTTGEVEVVKNITWIKSELTFEGLRQIKFEPAHRVYIGELQPREPTRKIDRIKFNFPTKSVLRRAGSSQDQDLCIALLKQPLYFSPYFTSIIGGRGTGKSTIINILAEKLGVRTDFFQKSRNSIFIEDKPFDIESSPKEIIEIIGTEEIEFISQGQIEKLAEGDELTNLIFRERIKELDPDFKSLDSRFNEIVDVIDESVKLAFELKKQSDNQKNSEREKSNLQKVIDSINDPEYKKITAAINEINTRLTTIAVSKKSYEDLLKSIKELLIQPRTINSDSEYDQRSREIIAIIKAIEEIQTTNDSISLTLKTFATTDKEASTLSGRLLELTKDLENFFATRGTSLESIKDSQNASAKLSRVVQDIESTKSKVDSIRTRLTENNQKVQELKEIYVALEKLVQNRIESINERLKIRNENVLEIKFIFEFNNPGFRDSLFAEFHRNFADYILPNTSSEDIKHLLFEIIPNEELLNLNHNEFSKRLEAILDEKSYKRVNKYVTVVLNIFSSGINFGIYKLLVRKHLYNLQAHIRIVGFYGARELSAASFGQRCTAVIVTLLMTGVKPLVIDEPEAHLDNKLIADYLVDLIKVKKMDRQIIFATHNSNFVINGDSELIHILEVTDGSNYTQLTSVSIEDTIHREKLLKLEGGKEAFLRREHRYGLQ